MQLGSLATSTNKDGLYMPETVLPPKRNLVANSTHRLSRLDVQRAMTDIKRFVEARLESDLKVVKVRMFDSLVRDARAIGRMGNFAEFFIIPHVFLYFTPAHHPLGLYERNWCE